MLDSAGFHSLDGQHIIITRIRDILDGILEAIEQPKAALPSKILLERCNLAGKPLTSPYPGCLPLQRTDGFTEWDTPHCKLGPQRLSYTHTQRGHSELD